jgi:hypothetical protein
MVWFNHIRKLTAIATAGRLPDYATAVCQGSFLSPVLAALGSWRNACSCLKEGESWTVLLACNPHRNVAATEYLVRNEDAERD